MSELHFESGATDEERRALLYCGAIFLYQPTDASLAFCEFARKLVAEAFNGLDPETAQHDFPVDEYIDVLKALKPHFIHHPHSKKHILNRTGFLGGLISWEDGVYGTFKSVFAGDP